MCATVRAIHLEIVQALSTQAFLHALCRFVAHHGWPQTIISDNGTSLVGPKGELKNLLEEGRKTLHDFAMRNKLKCKFNTPASPHQGGFFDMTKSVSKHYHGMRWQQYLQKWNAQ
jgi:transposase InsO family protein